MPEIKNDPSFSIQKSRSLSILLKDTFQYLSNEALLLFQALALYSFSILLMAMLSAYFFLGAVARFENLIYLKDSVSKPGLVILVVSSFAYAASFCTLTLVVNRLLLLRQQHAQEPETFLFSELKIDFPARFKTYALNFFIIYMAYQLLSYGIHYLDRISFLSDYSDIDFGLLNPRLTGLLSNLVTLIVMPLLVYFGFSSLFVSVRDDIGSSDALKKIYDLSKDKLPHVWLYSLVLLLLAYFGEWALNYRSGFYMRLLPLNFHLVFVVITLKKLLSFFLLVIIQVGVVLLFGSMEEEAKKQADTLKMPGDSV